MRKTLEIIEDIKNLVSSKGYIYALCMILFEDFHIDPERIQEIDFTARLSTKESSLLLGFFIQNEINYSLPESPNELIQLKQKTYALMEELHHSLMTPFFSKLEKTIKEDYKIKNYREDQKDFFGKGDLLIEPIFYSGTGIYDFQYLEFLEKKYKYDKDWLRSNKKFDLIEARIIVTKIKNILQERSKKVHLKHLREKLPELEEEFKKNNPEENWEKYANDVLPMMELHQYVELFFENIRDEKIQSIDDMREEGWKSFYKSIIDLSVIKKSDFDCSVDIDAFLHNFSIHSQNGFNPQFKTIGDYNLINSHPIINLGDSRFFVPISFLLFEAVYESPYYWMTEDKKYRDLAGKNRGNVGEEIAFDFLLKVFGISRTFKSVKVTTKKGHDDTDIDILCILGSKALCVQVKSKKLTELARKGDDKALNIDFKGAVQDAYEQGLICRNKILEKNATFIDAEAKKIQLSEEIDDVYIMCITTENYPSLTHQSHIMLDKKDADPFPLVLTIFDLELLIHYLDDPFDFLYYIKQRISLMDYFKADEEMIFLGYHLDQKLWKIPNYDLVALDPDYGQLVDRNYYPLKAGIELSDEGDTIKTRWQNERFNLLCNSLKSLNEPKATDILFYLYDLSGDTRKNIVDHMVTTKNKTLADGKMHDFSLPPDNSHSPRLGFTYITLNSDDTQKLKNRLFILCQARKYKNKGDVWIGFGSLKHSKNIIDIVAFNNQKWLYNENLEKATKDWPESKGRQKFIHFGRKIGPNEKCPCGSGIKYKKCCGKV